MAFIANPELGRRKRKQENTSGIEEASEWKSVDTGSSCAHLSLTSYGTLGNSLLTLSI